MINYQELYYQLFNSLEELIKQAITIEEQTEELYLAIGDSEEDEKPSL